jgi:hypothetical protein
VPGVKLEHKVLTTGLVTIPVFFAVDIWEHHRPVVGRDECPTCKIIHPVKTLHLNFNNGICIVAEGIVDSLKKMEKDPLAYDLIKNIKIGEEIKKPPNLTLDGQTSRPEIDHRNAAQQMWGIPYQP